MGNTLEQPEVKEIRAQLQGIVDILNQRDGGSRTRSLAITKIQEGKMWLGQVLGDLGGEDLNAKRDKIEVGAGTTAAPGKPAEPTTAVEPKEETKPAEPTTAVEPKEETKPEVASSAESTNKHM